VAPRSVHVEDAWLDHWWQATDRLAPETKWVLRLMLVSGLRVSEAMKLRWENIDEKVGTLTITNTKNGKPHTLPLTRGIQSNLPIRPQNASGLVFSNLSANRLRRAHAAIKEATGRHWTNHDLRRSCATIATRAGVPVYTLKRLLNHNPIGRDVTEAHYVQVTLADLREALDKIERHIRGCVNAPDQPETEQTGLTLVS
jgi:integrase